MIYFYYPSRAIGGSEYLILRLYLELRRRGRRCAIIDFPDGFFSKRLRGPQDVVIHCDDRMRVRLPEATASDVIIVLSLSIGALLRIEALAAKLVVWEVHKSFWHFLEQRISPSAMMKWVVSRILLRGVAKLADEGGLIVLEKDALNLAARCKVGFPQGIALVPIGLEASGEKKVPLTIINPVRIVSIGRSVREKIFPLTWFIRQLREDGISFRFTFITDSLVAAREEWARHGMEAPEMYEGLSDGSLRRYLVDNADIYVGMGTTVLEAARLGLPSIVIDACNDETYPAAACVRLGWENQLGNLGSFEPSGIFGHSPAESVRLIIGDYEACAAKILGYFEENHEIGGVCDRFERAISLTRATLGGNRWLRVGIGLMNIRYALILFSRGFGLRSTKAG